MPDSAQVRCLDTIEAFRGSLARFEQRVQNALETLKGEVRRADDWLQHDRPAYWKEQTRLAGDAVQEAKIGLERCLALPVADQRPACREEQVILNKAQARLDYCREQTELVRHWKRKFHHELFEYEGRVGQLQRMLETDLPRARASLRQIVRQLDAYQIERPPTPRNQENETNTEQQTFAEEESM